MSDRDVTSIRDSISRGSIARALGEGRAIDAPAAAGERAARGVLCAPIGKAPPLGVIYLEGRAGAGPFTAADREHTELLARQLAPLVDRLVRLGPGAGDRADHTADLRKRFACAEIVGRSAALARLLQCASDVAALEVDVLITGPSGTGKSMLARTIHNNSPRRGGPFVELNCAAMPEPLIENELFGSERGAHSTATRRTRGQVAAAAAGTLFLDEVAELSAGAQAKLLQLLETREYHALGSTTTERADVRIICATNANLLERVAARQFREDLYYRIHVVPLEVPGLDARRDDVPELVEHFAQDSCRRHKFPPILVSRRALAACRDASWPGHARQLWYSIQAGVIRAHGARASTLQEHHVFPGAAPGPEPLTLQQATRQFQRRFVREALDRNEWNVTETARRLDLARSHLYNLINELKLRDDA